MASGTLLPNAVYSAGEWVFDSTGSPDPGYVTAVDTSEIHSPQVGFVQNVGGPVIWEVDNPAAFPAGEGLKTLSIVANARKQGGSAFLVAGVHNLPADLAIDMAAVPGVSGVQAQYISLPINSGPDAMIGTFGPITLRRPLTQAEANAIRLLAGHGHSPKTSDETTWINAIWFTYTTAPFPVSGGLMI